MIGRTMGFRAFAIAAIGTLLLAALGARQRSLDPAAHAE
jgi:hypothetical protein